MTDKVTPSMTREELEWATKRVADLLARLLRVFVQVPEKDELRTLLNQVFATARASSEDRERLLVELNDAAITMRNYYAGAISRGVVDEKLERYRLAARVASSAQPEERP